jgi:proton-translocating NADH-quinone oxidoreductase chain N
VLALFVLVPLAGLVLLNLPLSAVRRSSSIYVAMALLAAQAVFVGLSPAFVTAPPPSFLEGLHFGMQADALTRVVLLSIGLVGFATALVAERTLSGDERKQHNFASLLLVALIGMNGTCSVTDFFTLYVFLEVTAVASFVLIVLRHDIGGVEGAFRYLVMSAVAGAMMLSGIGLFLLGADGLTFEAVHKALASSAGSPAILRLGLGLFVCGLFVKGGVMPLHGWLPGAYGESPAATSVLLAGIVTKVSGIYALLRIMLSVVENDAALNMVLLVAGTISILLGALAAIGQTDMKRMLAYSSISQVGYIVLALGGGSRLALIGTALHFFNHSVFKSLLFVDAAAVESRMGTTDMTRMGGIGSRMPITGATTVIGMLSAAGIPPLSGFWSKLIIVVALFQTDHQVFATIAILASVLTLAYFLVMQRLAFFGKPTAEVASLREADPAILTASVVLALTTLVIGIVFPLLLDSPLSFLLLDHKLPW